MQLMHLCRFAMKEGTVVGHLPQGSSQQWAPGSE